MIPKKPAALLLDLDGTLVDSRADIVTACNTALRDHGRAPLAHDAILTMVGDGARALVSRAFGLSPGSPEIEAALASYERAYREKPCEATVLLPGARELLASGVPCALVTNKPRLVAELVLERLGVRPSFAFVWGGGDGPLKPSPEGAHAALTELGVRGADAWFIGDGPQDVGAGRAAGCFTIAVDGIAEPEALLRAAPDRLVESLHEVVALLGAAR